MKVYLNAEEMQVDIDLMLAHFNKAVALRDSNTPSITIAQEVVYELNKAYAISKSISDGMKLLHDTINELVVPLASALSEELHN